MAAAAEPLYRVTLLCNRSNAFGLSDDLTVWERLLKQSQRFEKPHVADPREPCRPTDLQIHLETPVFAAIPWAHANVIMINPDHWPVSHDEYLHAFDGIVFRSQSAADEAVRRWSESDSIAVRRAHERVAVLPWCSSWSVGDLPTVKPRRNEVVCFMGGSENKWRALQQVVPLWRAGDPPLTIYTSRQDAAENLKTLAEDAAMTAGITAGITVIHTDLDIKRQYQLAATYAGHLVVSLAEGFGYAAAHAEVAGAYAILSDLPVFREYYGEDAGISWLSATQRADLAAALESFQASSEEVLVDRQRKSRGRWPALVNASQGILGRMTRCIAARRPKKGIHRLPPILDPADCPPITVITPTYNRKQLIDIAFYNLMTTDYPKDKIEWIVIEDNERTPHMAADKIVKFQMEVPTLSIKYIPIEGRMSIGEKRNIAVDKASHDIVLFMDDDDHYPVVSFRLRVAWLLKGRKPTMKDDAADAVCCTTIAMYDLLRGVSAVNVPPMELPFCQRISEATLTFHKSFWVDRHFPNVSMAEGEEWIRGREERVLEIPPQHIVVAFTHQGNQSSRRIPPKDNQPPSCFWGFSRDYLQFIHGLAGVQIEDAAAPKSSVRR